jgi:hypothetical protein
LLWENRQLSRTFGFIAAALSLVAFAPSSHAFQSAPSNALDTMSAARLADPDDLLQSMDNEQSGGTVALPGGSGSLQLNSGANAPGGANSPFLPRAGSAIVPSQR